MYQSYHTLCGFSVNFLPSAPEPLESIGLAEKSEMSIACHHSSQRQAYPLLVRELPAIAHSCSRDIGPGIHRIARTPYIDVDNYPASFRDTGH